MTLTATALAPWLMTASMTSRCTAASPWAGRRNNNSTPSSASAFLAPASAMVQKDSGLLLTKATLVLPEPPEHAGSKARAMPRAIRLGTRKSLMIATRLESGFDNAATEYLKVQPMQRVDLSAV